MPRLKKTSRPRPSRPDPEPSVPLSRSTSPKNVAPEIDYRVLFELACDPIFISDPQGRYLEANRAATELTGYSRTELLRKHVGDLAPPEEAEDAKRQVDLLRRTGRSSRVGTIVRKDGARLTVECHNTDMGNQTYLGMVRDISNRLAVERALQQSNAEYTSLVGLCPDAVISADDDMRITLWNPAAEAMFGYTRGEALGRRVRDLIPQRHWERASRAWQTHFRPDPPQRFARLIVTEALRKDGTEVPVELSVGVGDHAGRRAFTAVARDITAQQHVLDRLNDVLQRLQFHVDRMPLAYIVWDKDFRVIEWNPAAERVFGYARPDAIGRAAWDLVPDDARSAVEKIWEDLQGGDTSSHSVNDNVRKDGTRITCEWFNTPLRDPTGRIVAVASMAMDISERELREVQRRNNQKLEVLGVMASGIAHDFNSLLMVIVGNAELLRSLKGLPLRAQDHIAMIEQSGLRASNLIKHMLAYARTGRHNPQFTDVNQVIREAEPFIRSSIGTNHEIVFQPAENLPGVLIDRGQVEQVLLQLCLNAKQAMKDGGTITIQTRRAELIAPQLSRCIPHDAPPGSYLELTVLDTGCGMSESTLSRAFDPFFTTKTDGHGLGLAAALGILRQHRAVALVESREGQGTRMHLYFPMAAETSPEWMVKRLDTGSKSPPKSFHEQAGR